MLPFPFPTFPPLAPGKLTPRQRVVAQWRGIDLAPLEKARARRAESVRAVLPKVLSDLRIDRRRAEAEVGKVWNDLLDPEVGAHAQPTGWGTGTLLVAVYSKLWLRET